MPASNQTSKYILPPSLPGESRPASGASSTACWIVDTQTCPEVQGGLENTESALWLSIKLTSPVAISKSQADTISLCPFNIVHSILIFLAVLKISTFAL